MKSFTKYFAIVLALSTVSIASAQQAELDNFRDPAQKGINVFETPKAELKPFEGLKVRVGGDFAMQLQGLRQSNNDNSFVDLETNMNLPTANLNIDVQMYRGARLHLRTYLSARHHNESWVKGGYFQIDALDFIQEGFLDNVMQYVSLRAGMDEINYGDTHFRRTDNAKAIYNPFVGNFIMDSFSTEAFMEANFQYKGALAVLGVSNGKLNQSTVKKAASDNSLSYFGKLGYDNQLNQDLRLRVTGSIYTNQGKTTGGYLYSGDRAGDRYYNFAITTAEDAGGTTFVNAAKNARFSPSFKQITAMQFAGFVKFKSLESFSLFEIASNSKAQGDGSYTQIGEELLYRLGAKDNFYVAGRFNKVFGKDTSVALEKNITRINVGGGWFMTENVLTKIEYVSQKHDGAGYTGKWAGAEFSGFMIEAVISF